MPLISGFDPSAYEGQDRLQHIEKHLTSHSTAINEQLAPRSELDFVASVEDLYAQAPFAIAATMSATTQVGIFVALTRVKVTNAGLMLFNSAVVANDTNFWTVQLLRWRAGGSVTIATKNTKIAGGAGESIAQRQGWIFDAITFDLTNQILEPGDGVDFLFTPTGAPTALNNGIASMRYEPL